jgi:hypothetical protein
MTLNPQDFHSYQGLETPNTNPYDELWECKDSTEFDDSDECEEDRFDDEDLI